MTEESRGPRRAEDGAAPIVVETDLDAPPEKVWRALTERQLLAEWLMPNDFRPVAGHRFRFGDPKIAANDDIAPDGAVECRVLECEPPHRLSYSWRQEPTEAGGFESIVTFVLRATPAGGTRLVIVHDGFSTLAFARLSAAPRATLALAA